MRNPFLFAFAAVPLALAGCGAADESAGPAGNIADAAAGDVVNVVDETAGEVTDGIGEGLEDIGNEIGAPGESEEADRAGTWTGRWTGVEGTFVEIAPDPERGPDAYRLTMQYTLDDRGTFPATLTEEGMRFRRPDGEQRMVRTDGAATGLKYLMGKKDCLTVRPGEGYCRD